MINLNKEEKIIEFISFCVENYKMKYCLKGRDAINMFEQNDVIKFLTEGYEMLHTQGKDYIIAEINSYIKNRGNDI